MRGQKDDWDHWAALGNRGWSWDDVVPIFRSLEDFEEGPVDGYGAGGEVRVENPRVRWDIIDAWREAAAECGIPPVKQFNGGDNFGCAYFQMNQKRGRRWSATNAFLRPAMHRPNLTVMTGAHVLKLKLDGRVAAGVEFAHREQRFFAEARRETILSAGAIGSPQILQLSGIGPAELLKRHVPARREEQGRAPAPNVRGEPDVVDRRAGRRRGHRRRHAHPGPAAQGAAPALRGDPRLEERGRPGQLLPPEIIRFSSSRNAKGPVRGLLSSPR